MFKEQEEAAYNLLVKYGKTFSLRDEMGTCPNFEIYLQVIDKSLFYIRPLHMKEEGKPMIDKEMQRSVHLGFLKLDMSSYSSLIMLIARKNSSFEKNHY